METSVPVSIPLALIDQSALVFHESDVLDIRAPDIDCMFQSLFTQAEEFLNSKPEHIPHPEDFLLKDDILEDKPTQPRRHQLPWEDAPTDPRPKPSHRGRREIVWLMRTDYGQRKPTTRDSTKHKQEDAQKRKRGTASKQRRNRRRAMEFRQRTENSPAH